ncbi:hypothetical protein L1887_20760 [Cichorium endivia]|nr:hypothetical protein L1887_20760 [Cichorium endivia]
MLYHVTSCGGGAARYNIEVAPKVVIDGSEKMADKMVVGCVFFGFLRGPYGNFVLPKQELGHNRLYPPINTLLRPPFSFLMLRSSVDPESEKRTSQGSL